jgi:putative photosynthetic complex assembly protein
MKSILTKKLIFKSSLPFFIVCSLISLVALVAVFQITGSNPYSISEQFIIKAEKEIALEIGKNGETFILDEAGNVLLRYSKDQENFVSTVAKVLKRERKKNSMTKNSNVVLRISQENRLSIYDPQTDQVIDLAGFGEGNIQVFYDILN